MPLLPQYATGSSAPVWDVSCKPHIFGVSGFSGAGTTPSDKNDPAKLRDNLLAYALVNHSASLRPLGLLALPVCLQLICLCPVVHEREVGFHCGVPVAVGCVIVFPHAHVLATTTTPSSPCASAVYAARCTILSGHFADSNR